MPSKRDILLTRQAVQAGQLLCISVLDYLVLGAGQYVSMGEHGLCDFDPPGAPELPETSDCAA